VALVAAAALLVAGGAVAVAQAAGGKGKGKAKHAVAKHLIRAGVHADVSLIRADGTKDAFAVDRGKVTAASSTSLTIQRADGKTVTFSIPTTAAVRGTVTVGRPVLVFSRNGAAFRIGAPGAALAPAPLMPALRGKSPITHLDVSFVRADGTTGSATLDRGQVTATSSTSLTIKRADGASVTFTIGTSTRVLGHLVVGGKALVVQRDGAVVRVYARGAAATTTGG
jgi:hypothetical protein